MGTEMTLNLALLPIYNACLAMNSKLGELEILSFLILRLKKFLMAMQYYMSLCQLLRDQGS